MKILGFEINAKRVSAAEPLNSINPSGVSLVKNLQKTEPSLPLSRSKPRAELGDSGTRLIHGIITEEYNPQLQGIEGIKIFDEMRKNDGTVRAAMLVCTLPIRRAEWFIKPANDEKESQDVANFVEHALFDWLDITWDDVIRQALLMTVFGVMVFEKVYGTKEHDGKTYVTLTKLAPRLPKSILMWELADHTFGIQQIRQDGVLAQIPGNKLLILVNEREGDNWWGNSMLRSAYKHWYYKDNFYKIDAVAFERQGLGVPFFKMPVGYTVSDEKAAQNILANLRASESSFLTFPNTYEFGFADMGAKGTRDPETSINHHNKEILQSVLAQFLELGATRSGSGSRALSQDHSDLFLKGIESIATTIMSEINKTLIPELVDLNFNDIKAYPVLDYSGISKVDMTALGQAYSQLVTAGAINPTDDDQQWIRAAMGLPPRTEEDIQKAHDDEESMETLTSDTEDVEIDPNGDDEGLDVDNDNPGNKPDPKGKTKKPVVKKKPATVNKAHDHSGKIQKLLYTDPKTGFQSWRPLTFAENKVSFDLLQKAMDDMEASFTSQAKDILNMAKDAFMAKLKKAIDAGDTSMITDIEVSFVGAYKDLLKDAMKTAYEYGKNNVSTEMGLSSIPPNTADTLATFNLLADTIANKAAADIAAKAKISMANALKTDVSDLQTLGSIDASIEDVIDKTVLNTSGLLVSQSLNAGRNDVFTRNQGMIYALQRSEVLDKKTCSFCLSIDGRVIAPTDDWASADTFHTNCRGIWVEILNDEMNPPPITGVPDEIGDYYGGEPNQLIQPPKPIVEEGSLAQKEVDRRNALKKK